MAAVGERQMYDRIYELLEQTGQVKSAVVLTGNGIGCRCLWSDGRCMSLMEQEPAGCVDWTPFAPMIDRAEETKVIEADGTEILVEIFKKNPRLILLGGGHVSRPTAHLGKMLGFHVTVMDDREEFVTEERFPDADERILGTFDELSAQIPPYENSWYVVMTRGHAGDTVCARQILARPYAYLGMIGSRTKVRLTREALLKEGFAEEQLNTIHAPIGIPIGGQLPEEIAVSIAAELVQEKNRNYTAFTDEEIAREVLRGTHGVMMTIVKKNGSSPRGTGSKMFLTGDGSLLGSIGGGSVEYEAMRHAAMVKRAEIQAYCLSAGEERNLGMICGGSVEVLFERI